MNYGSGEQVSYNKNSGKGDLTIIGDMIVVHCCIFFSDELSMASFMKFVWQPSLNVSNMVLTNQQRYHHAAQSYGLLRHDTHHVRRLAIRQFPTVPYAFLSQGISIQKGTKFAQGVLINRNLGFERLCISNWSRIMVIVGTQQRI